MFVDLVLSLAAGLSALLIFLYYWYKGQFDDVEDVKYQMFRDESEDKDD